MEATEGAHALRVGMRIPHDAFAAGPSRLGHLLRRVDASRLDQVCVGDHVSFRDGTGYDGLLQAGVICALSERVMVHTAVYVLPLRHPVPVARQVASIAELAPGRLVLGVGVGGDDPHEAAVCGVVPATRGRRTDEGLTILRQLLSGETASYHGEYFQFSDARILPVPSPVVSIPVGGRSPAAIRRAGLLGDGWYGLWVSPSRYAEVTAQVEGVAAAAGRRPPAQWEHHMLIWCGIGDSPKAARRPLADAMEQLYGVTFDKFERWCPSGEPSDIADALAPFLEAGCRSLNLIPVAEHHDAAVDGVAEVGRLLRARIPVPPAATVAGSSSRCL